MVESTATAHAIPRTSSNQRSARLGVQRWTAVHWVFGYGSLIWNPDFESAESHLGQLHGYHRTFCIGSTKDRGTPEAPGVVLGLERGGSCIGMTYRLHRKTRHAALETLYAREMTIGVYVPKLMMVSLRDGRAVEALTFIANRQSAMYERLGDDEILRRLTECCGTRGDNLEYAINTWHSLASRGVQCQHLTRVTRSLIPQAVDIS